MEEGFAGDEISLIELMNVVLKYRRLVVLVPLIVFVLVVGYTFLQPRTWTASGSFIPQAKDPAASLGATLASQFGMTIPAGEPGQSPAFYADLLQSTEVICRIVDSSYTFEADGIIHTGSIPDLFGIEDENPDRRCDRAIRQTSEMISVSTDRETGVVAFSVRTPWAPFSLQVAHGLLEEVNRFNLKTRKSRAMMQRQFVEDRVAQSRAELHVAEDSLQGFLKKNRQWELAPELEFVHDRLRREVDMRQQVFTSLNQAYEQARIDEVRDLPVITVVHEPRVPTMPDRRRLILKGILALMVGGMMGIFGAFGGEFLVRGREQEADDFAEFERLSHEAVGDLLHPWRFFRI